MKRNKFSKALKHLKSKKIDEKIKGLEEAAPTNSMSGVYQVTPSTGDAFRMGAGDPPRRFYPKADGSWPAGIPANAGDRYYDRVGGYFETGKGTVPADQNNTPRDLSLTYMNANGNDTSTMIRASDGMVYADLPEGTRNFILGPLITSYTQNHAGLSGYPVSSYDDFTNLGYIQKDTRQFVLLGRIEGFLDGTKKANGVARTWDGTATQFTSYNSNFTLEHALWMQQRYNEGNFTANVPFNLSGGIPADRHPDDASKASGDMPGSNAGQAGGDDDDIGTPQDPADVNDINSLNLAGMTYSDLPPKPNRSDYPNTRSGAAAFSRAMRKWNKLEAALAKKAGLETTNPIFNQDNFDTVKDAASKFANILWQGAKIVTGAKAAEIIADLTLNPIVDAAFGQSVADSAGDYNTKLATALTTSVITGKPHRIILSPKAKKDLINSIDPEMLKKHMTIGPTPDPSADNAINPGKGKVAGILKGKWGNQGGTHINYDMDTGKFTITSVKMLRNFGELDQKDAGGKITNFEDIPNPSVEDIKKIFKQKGLEGPLKKFYNTMANLKISSSTDDKSFRPFAGGYNPEEAAEMMYNGLPDMTKALYNFAVEGTASNAVHLRNQLLKVGVPQSDIEKMGGGFGGYVYSQETYLGNDIPGNHSDANSVTGILNRKAMKALGISESRKIDEKNKVKILREIRQPLKEIKELPKTTKLKGYKPNFKGKFSPQNTPDVTASKQSDDIVSGKNASRQVWTAKDKYWKGYETTERMNIIYDNLGHGSQYFDRIVGENVRLKNKKSREVQEHLNMLAHQKAMKEVYGIKEFENFIDESETFDNKINDPLFTKVAKRLKKEIDYPKKPAAKGYPNEAPPKIDPNTGMHPKFGKRYKYDKLDPISAKTMAGAPTGDPEIDANVKRQAQKEDWRSDLKNLWLGAEREEWKKKLEEGMTTTDTFSYSIPGRGDDILHKKQTGFTGDGDINDFDHSTGIHNGGEFTGMTSFTDHDNVEDPHDLGKLVRSYSGFDSRGHRVVPTSGDGFNGTSDGTSDFWPGKSGGFRGVTFRGSYNSFPYTAIGGPTDENHPMEPVDVTSNETKLNYTTPEPSQYMSNRVGSCLFVGGGPGSPGVPRLAALKAVDTTEMDTLSLNWFTTGLIYTSGSGDDLQTHTRDSTRFSHPGDDIFIYYWAGDKEGAKSFANPSSTYGGKSHDGWRPLHINPQGVADFNYSSIIIPHKAMKDGGGSFRGPSTEWAGYRGNTFYNSKLTLPPWARDASTRFMIVQNQITTGTAYAVWGITSLNFQRQQAMSVGVPLDDPQAVSFIRTGTPNLTAKEKKKKVIEMLRASRAYTTQKYGKDFPYRTQLEPEKESQYTPAELQADIKRRQAINRKQKQSAARARQFRATGRVGGSRSRGFRGYQRTGRDSKGMTTRARVNPKDIIGSI